MRNVYSILARRATRLSVVVLVGVQLTAVGQTRVMLRTRDGGEQQFTLRAHPRVWLDGNGPIATSVRDPDGPGPLKSPKAAGPLWAALQKRLESLKPREPVDLSGVVAMYTALGWFMDNNATYADGRTYREVALKQLRNVDTVWTGLGACDAAVNYCGTSDVYPGTHTSYMGNLVGFWAQAYTLMRSQLTVPERKAFAEKILNGITKDIGGNCIDRYERLPGSLIINSAYSASGTGTSWNQSMVGQWFYSKRADQPTSAGLFVHALSVANSGSMGLERPGSNLFLNVPLHLYRIKPWASGQCGMGYVADNHPNIPTYVTAYQQTATVGAISTTGTTVVLEDTSSMPKIAPFFLRLGPSSGYEEVRVTAIAGNQVTISRGEFSTKPVAWPTKTRVLYQSHTGPGDAMGWNNRTITRQVGHIMAAIALADDDPRAVTLLKETLDYWQSNTWFAANNYFTILNTAATSYGLSREMPFFLWSVQSMYASFVPALDYRGKWIKWAGSEFYFHWAAPWDRNALVNFGIAADNCQSLGKGAEIQCSAPAVFLQTLFPGSDEAKRAWWWLNEGGVPTDITRLTADSGERILVPLILFTDGSLAKTDFRSKPPQWIASASSNQNTPDSNVSALSSRTNWTPDATMLYVLAPDTYTKEYPKIPLSEKLFDDLFGEYGIGKNGWFLGQVNTGYWTPATGTQNVVDFGPVSYGVDGIVNPLADMEFDRQKADPAGRFVYVRADVKRGYGPQHQVTRALRSYVHFKQPGETEQIIVYDDYGSNLAQNIRGMLHYLNNGASGKGQTALSANAAQVTSDNTKATLFTQVVKVSGAGTVTDLNVDWSATTATVGSYCSATRPCRARFGSKVFSFTQPGTLNMNPAASGVSEAFVWLGSDGQIRAAGNGLSVSCSGSLLCSGSVTAFPAGVLPLGRLTYKDAKLTGGCPAQTGTKWGAEYHHCVGAAQHHLFMDAGSGVNAAEFLVVHQPVTGLAGSPDPATAISAITAGFTGVQMSGANPKVAAFGGGGIDYSMCRMTTNHTGRAHYLVTGLAAGTYRVLRGATVVATNLAVSASDGAVYFDSDSGDIQVERIGTAEALAFANAAASNATAGMPYLQKVGMTGGAGPYRLSILGDLPPGLAFSSDGQFSGVPQASGLFRFIVVGVDVTGNKVTGDFQLVVLPPDNSVLIDPDTLPRGSAHLRYEAKMNAFGGTGTYTWIITDGDLPEGIELDDESGVLRGVPSSPGVYRLSLMAVDANGQNATRTVEILID